MTGMDEPEEGSVLFSSPEEEFEALRTIWLRLYPDKTGDDFTMTKLRGTLHHAAELEYTTGHMLFNGQDPGEHQKPLRRFMTSLLNVLMPDGEEPAWLADPDDPEGDIHRTAWAAAEVADWLGMDEHTPDWLRTWPRRPRP